jgi:hypothetical protein
MSLSCNVRCATQGDEVMQTQVRVDVAEPAIPASLCCVHDLDDDEGVTGDTDGEQDY